jgi:hypothetical protein
MRQLWLQVWQGWCLQVALYLLLLLVVLLLVLRLSREVLLPQCWLRVLHLCLLTPLIVHLPEEQQRVSLLTSGRPHQGVTHLSFGHPLLVAAHFQG